MNDTTITTHDISDKADGFLGNFHAQTDIATMDIYAGMYLKEKSSFDAP